MIWEEIPHHVLLQVPKCSRTLIRLNTATSRKNHVSWFLNMIFGATPMRSKRARCCQDPQGSLVFKKSWRRWIGDGMVRRKHHFQRQLCTDKPHLRRRLAGQGGKSRGIPLGNKHAVPRLHMRPPLWRLSGELKMLGFESSIFFQYNPIYTPVQNFHSNQENKIKTTIWSNYLLPVQVSKSALLQEDTSDVSLGLVLLDGTFYK